MSKSIVKKVEPTGDVCVKFTEEEMQQLNIAPGDKFSMDIVDGGIMLKKFVKVEIDISDWSRELLESLIDVSCTEDISVNEVISNIIKKRISKDGVISGDVEPHEIPEW
jgi:hypothetical protein